MRRRHETKCPRPAAQYRRDRPCLTEPPRASGIGSLDGTRRHMRAAPQSALTQRVSDGGPRPTHPDRRGAVHHHSFYFGGAPEERGTCGRRQHRPARPLGTTVGGPEASSSPPPPLKAHRIATGPEKPPLRHAVSGPAGVCRSVRAAGRTLGRVVQAGVRAGRGRKSGSGEGGDCRAHFPPPPAPSTMGLPAYYACVGSERAPGGGLRVTQHTYLKIIPMTRAGHFDHPQKG